MLDGDGQDQYDAGGWCFPKPIPPVQRNGDWIVRLLRRPEAARCLDAPLQCAHVITAAGAHR